MDNEKSSSKLLPTEEEDKRVKASQMCLLNQEKAQENKPPLNNTATPPYPMQGTYVKQDSPQGVYPQPRPRIVAPPKPNFGRDPINMECNYCHQLVTSKVRSKVGAAAWATSGIICASALLLLFPLLCVCIPCCIPSLRDHTHYCPSCGQVLGRSIATRNLC